MSNDLLRWLQTWYVEQCDGDWEHQNGIKILTLDNPGWSLEIDVDESLLAKLSQARGKEYRTDDDWITYEIKDSKFVGFCGPGNLGELLQVFRTAVTEAKHDK